MTKKFKFYFLWMGLISIIMFILQQIPGFTEMFVLNSLAITNFEIWRFLTAIFLHGDITHLVYNLFALLFFGIAVEKLIGSERFLILFLSSGIIANLISINFYPSSLGASGAIYGILGALTIIKPFMMVWAFGLIMPMFIAAIVWIIGDVIGIFVPSNVGNIAHLSGIGIGFILGLIFKLKFRKYNQKNKTSLKIPDSYVNAWEKTYMK